MIRMTCCNTECLGLEDERGSQFQYSACFFTRQMRNTIRASEKSVRVSKFSGRDTELFTGGKCVQWYGEGKVCKEKRFELARND